MYTLTQLAIAIVSTAAATFFAMSYWPSISLWFYLRKRDRDDAEFERDLVAARKERAVRAEDRVNRAVEAVAMRAPTAPPRIPAPGSEWRLVRIPVELGAQLANATDTLWKVVEVCQPEITENTIIIRLVGSGDYASSAVHCTLEEFYTCFN